MKRAAPSRLSPEAALFRRRLLVALGLMIAGTTAAALFAVRRNVATDEEHAREQEFQGGLAVLHSVQQTRHAALVERCRSLAQRSRIHAALEDDAFDLLYPSAGDEMRDVLASGTDPRPGASASALHALFYRFLDASGRVIAPGPAGGAGALSPAEEKQLSLAAVPDRPQFGYLVRHGADGEALTEMIATPVFSNATGEKLAALVLGFEPVRLEGNPAGEGFFSGIWVGEKLYPSPGGRALPADLSGELQEHLARPGAEDGRFRVDGRDEPWLVFFQHLNRTSSYPPAYEVCAFPLGAMIARQSQLGWKIVGAGGALILAGFILSYFLSFRLSAPVERLALDSREQRAQRARAEAALESTSAELQRAARFSANASHQLKTPVTVLRAGLEQMMAKDTRTHEECDEISGLIHQTYRLSSVIEDLLLLSRMDAGQLRLTLAPVDLSELIAASLDDLNARPDGGENLAIEAAVPPGLLIAGEKRYTSIILQNLLENARKYNRPAGRIRISAHQESDAVLLVVGNTTRQPIPPDVREHIFERFHRGGMGENIPGYGLGLNLAHELARIHNGDLRLVRSDDEWTEFEARFQVALNLRSSSSHPPTA